METTTTRRSVAILAVILAGLVLLLGGRMRAIADTIQTFQISRGPSQREFDGPILAMELPRNADDLRAVVGDGPDDRSRMLSILRLDTWFIAVYTGLFLALTWLARRRGSRAGGARRIALAGTIMAALATLAVLVAAAGDVAENLAIEAALAPGGIDDAGAAAIRRAALVKWTAFYVATGWIGLLLMTRKYRSEKPRLRIAVSGNLFLLAATVGLGVWIVPNVVTFGMVPLLGAVPLLLATVLAKPGVLDDPIQVSRPEPPPGTLAKADHLLPLALAADEEVRLDPKGTLAAAFRRRRLAYLATMQDATLPRVHKGSSAGEVPREVRLELLADLLVTECPDEARRLARTVPQSFPRVIDRLSAEAVEGLSRSAIAAEILAELRDQGIDAARPRDEIEWAQTHDRLRVELLLRPSLAARLAERTGTAVPFALAQQAELDEIRASREARLDSSSSPGAAGYAPRRAFGFDLVGLAFSGGGIRSATFNLGVLQALADLRLLQRIDYLCTVSGGGYIGSWFASWAKRLDGGVGAVQEQLSPERSPEPNAPSVRPIRFLREYSNYLTPQRGLLGADTWTLIAIWLRNTLLIQSVLVLFLSVILLVPRLIGLLARMSAECRDEVFWGMSAGGLWLFLVLCLRTGTELGRFSKADAERLGTSLDADWAPPSKAGTDQVQLTIVLPGFAVGMLLVLPLWHWALVDGGASAVRLPWNGSPLLGIGAFAALLFAIGVVVVEVRAGYARALVARAASRRAKVVGAVVLALATVAPAMVGGALVAGLASLFRRWANVTDLAVAAGTWHVVALGPPLIIGILGVSLMLHIGLIGLGFDDDRREWTSRLGAWLLIWSVGWLAAFGLAVYGPLLVAAIGKRLAAAGGLAWIASAVWGAWAGHSPSTDSRSIPGKNPTAGSEGWGSGLKDAALQVAPYVFVVGLLILLSWGVHLLLLGLSAGPAGWTGVSWSTLFLRHWSYMNATSIGWTAILMVTVAAATLLLAWRVDVNEFSLHHLYKNRLVRCYLGASRQGDRWVRRAHPFTGFDREDDVPLATLRTAPRPVGPVGAEPGPGNLESYKGPLPIIATALNLVKGEDLAWQERKAQSFVFTPLFSGYEQVPVGPPRSGRSPRLAADGLRPTRSYGYAGGGIRLGTAFAISGAAANPSMGYHSSPAAAFLMTMFNVRLGWWMGNPRDEGTWRQASPTFGLTALIRELTGATTNTSGYVNLSDGGHFENLGIYELVRRRCRFIIACDAEQDGELTFGGLGSAIRKCRTDFGVEIRIHPDPIRLRDEMTRRSAAHFAMGDILYPGGDRGLLCYLKAALTGNEPGDVLEYALRVAEFPHESTADQFFDESQFESYRQLGYYVARSVLDGAVGALEDSEARDKHDTYWRELFARLVPAPPLPAAPSA